MALAGVRHHGASNFDALRNGLGELGYVEGRSIIFERRWADGAAARLLPLATELVRLKVDVICTAGTPIGAHRTNVQWRCGPPCPDIDPRGAGPDSCGR
jgi:hypothetical protein